MGYEPAAGVVPEMIPVSAVSVSPAGIPVAVKSSGAAPVAGIANTNGVVGREPTTNGARKRGVAGAASIEMVTVDCASAGAAMLTPQANVARRHSPKRPKRGRGFMDFSIPATALTLRRALRLAGSEYEEGSPRKNGSRKCEVGSQRSICESLTQRAKLRTSAI